MLSKTIYLNAIKEFETHVGFSFINGDEIAQKLQTAWQNDKTEAKIDYLDAYREVFREVLNKWSDSELLRAFQARSETMPNFKNCLLKTDETLKLCAMSLIPELRENEDVLSHMTFGVIESTKLKDEFIFARRKYLQTKASESAVQKHKAVAYDKYKNAWKETTVRRITELVRDEDALKLMSPEEKIDFALALSAYRDDENAKQFIDSRGRELIEDALKTWEKELGCTDGDTVEDFVASKYFNYAQKLGNNEWLENQVNEAIDEYNKTPNRAKHEIEHYKEVEKQTAELKQVKERAIPTVGVEDDAAEMVGDFFRQEELTQEIEAPKAHKEYVFLQDKVTEFNREYSLTMNHNKLRTSIEQLSVLMIKAREEKQSFLAKDSVVIIENGKETRYDVNDYYKKLVDDAKKNHDEEVKKVNEEREKAQKEYKELIESFEKHAETLGDALERIKAENQKKLDEKNVDFDKAIAKAKADLDEKMSSAQAVLTEQLTNAKEGIVVVKNGESSKEYKASRYYETHETQKEQYAYGQYQLMFSRVYKDACKNVKEKTYSKGKITNFSHIAKDVDNLFKSAMYLSNVYDNEKNNEIVQKCSFGGLSAERLSSLATYIDGDNWTKNQMLDETVWGKQISGAKDILSRWGQYAKYDKRIKPGNLIKLTLEKRLNSFKKGEITKKQLLDYMIAGKVFMQEKYPSNFRKLLNPLQSSRANGALKKCLTALGLTENSSLRVALKEEYDKMARAMSKEQIFNSVETRMSYALDFNAEKMALEKEHQIVKDREITRKKDELEQLKSLDKEPISIPTLDERKIIVHQKPRVEPVATQTQAKPNLSIN